MAPEPLANLARIGQLKVEARNPTPSPPTSRCPRLKATIP
jgi:hypothetical protein